MSLVKPKLSVMMLLQYAVWGAWAVPMGSYLGTLNFSGGEIGLIYGTTAIAAMISPLYIGFLADRMFATEKMIAILHLIGAVLMTAAASQTTFMPTYVIMIAYALCYMPTLALTNSISFANIKDAEKEFPFIRVFGTFGWIFAGWAVSFVLQNEDLKGIVPDFVQAPASPLYLSAALSAVLGLFSFLLPHTPPTGGSKATAPTENQDRKGVMQLMGDPSFVVFVVASFLVCIPLSFYYAFANVFLGEIDAPYPTALQTIGQMSEVGFMALMPWFITRLGVKRMLAIGMMAWVARYFLFGTLNLPPVLVGLVLHGICYDFFFVASQIYVDSRVSESTRASAQSFIAFVTLGLGMFVGSYLSGKIVDAYPPAFSVNATVIEDGKSVEKKVGLPEWHPKEKKGLAALVNADGVLTSASVTGDLVENQGKKNEITYKQADLTVAIDEVAKQANAPITRTTWRAAQAKDWYHIWLWPALMALGTVIVFWLGFREPAKVASRGNHS